MACPVQPVPGTFIAIIRAGPARPQEDDMSRLKLLTAAALLASFVGGPPLTIAASASPVANAHEDRSDKRDRKEDKKRQKEIRKVERRNVRADYWDASRHYRRDDRRYRPRQLS